MLLRFVRYSLAAALAVTGSFAVLACTFTVDLEPLQDGDCGENAKLCLDPMDGVEKCVDFLDPNFGCAVQSTCRPCAPQNATAVCSTGGTCTYGACDPGYDDCNFDRTDGCETDTDFSADHCGECNNACSLANADSVCVQGRCRVDGCADGFEDCNGEDDDGCECHTSDGGNDVCAVDPDSNQPKCTFN